MKFFSAALAAILLLSLSISQAQSRFQQYHFDDDDEVVVLMHGLARSNIAMWTLNIRLKRAGYHVEPVGYRSLRNTPEEIMQDVTAQIDRCCKDISNKVHFVGHSLGGLLIRKYLQDNQIKNLGRVVLIGTPDRGTEESSFIRDKWWATLAGPTAMALATEENSFPDSLDKPYYAVGVIAGVYDSDMRDPVVPGTDENLASMESAKLEGMSDFIWVKSRHGMMRYKDEIADQAISFLRNGVFNRNQ